MNGECIHVIQATQLHDGLQPGQRDTSRRHTGNYRIWMSGLYSLVRFLQEWKIIFRFGISRPRATVPETDIKFVIYFYLLQ
ncbi:hypothetical protein D3C73_694480 [compost metagenome]